MNRAHHRPDSWLWLRDQEEDDLIPIIGERLRAAREHLHLKTRELADRTGGIVSKSKISKIERGEIRSTRHALALARALTPEAADATRVLSWLVNPREVLADPEAAPLSPSAQIAEYHRKAAARAGMARLLLAERQQSGKWGEWVELGDGTRMMVVLHPPPLQ